MRAPVGLYWPRSPLASQAIEYFATPCRYFRQQLMARAAKILHTMPPSRAIFLDFRSRFQAPPPTAARTAMRDAGFQARWAHARRAYE